LYRKPIYMSFVNKYLYYKHYCLSRHLLYSVMFRVFLDVCPEMSCVMFSRHLSCNAMSCVVFSRHLSRIYIIHVHLDICPSLNCTTLVLSMYLICPAAPWNDVGVNEHNWVKREYKNETEQVIYALTATVKCSVMRTIRTSIVNWVWEIFILNLMWGSCPLIIVTVDSSIGHLLLMHNCTPKWW